MELDYTKPLHNRKRYSIFGFFFLYSKESVKSIKCIYFVWLYINNASHIKAYI